MLNIKKTYLIPTGMKIVILRLKLAPVLEKAFRRGKPDMVALEINSPGGSPVQSSLIGARIRRLAEEMEGMEVVDALYSGYGESPTRGGEGVYAAMAIAKGDEYLTAEFPLLDRIEQASIEEGGS